MLLIPVPCSAVKYSNFCMKSSYIFTDVLAPPGGSPHSCDGGLRRGVFIFIVILDWQKFMLRSQRRRTLFWLSVTRIFFPPINRWKHELSNWVGTVLGPVRAILRWHMRSEVRVCTLRSNLYREVKPSTEFVRSDSFLSKTRAFGTKASSSAEKRQTRRTTTGRRPRLEARPPSRNACDDRVV